MNEEFDKAMKEVAKSYYSSKYYKILNTKEIKFMDEFFYKLRLRIKRILKNKDIYFAPTIKEQMDNIDKKIKS